MFEEESLRCRRMFSFEVVFANLMDKASKGNTEEFNHIISQNPTITTARDDLGFTAIHKAISNKHLKCLQLLLPKMTPKDFQVINSLDPPAKCSRDRLLWCRKNQNIFTYAAIKGSFEMVKLLLPWMDYDERKRVCCASSNNYAVSSPMCLLHAAIVDRRNAHEMCNIVSLLLESGCNINCSRYMDDLNSIGDCYGHNRLSFSVLACAVMSEHIKVVQELLKHGAEVNPTFSNAAHPLVVTITTNNVAICKLLLKYEANPNIFVQCGKYKRYPALLASCLFLGSCLYEMLKAGANLQLLDDTFWNIIAKQSPCSANFFRHLRKTFGQWSVPMENDNPGTSSNIEDYENLMKEAKVVRFDVDNHTFVIIQKDLIAFVGEVMSLKHLCRTSIINQILETENGNAVPKSVKRLPLPETLKLYLNYDNE